MTRDDPADYACAECGVEAVELRTDGAAVWALCPLHLVPPCPRCAATPRGGPPAWVAVDTLPDFAATKAAVAAFQAKRCGQIPAPLRHRIAALAYHAGGEASWRALAVALGLAPGHPPGWLSRLLV